jgi:hypothetical protein
MTFTHKHHCTYDLAEIGPTQYMATPVQYMKVLLLQGYHVACNA